MKLVEKELMKKVKKIEGKLLVIGLDNKKVIKEIEKNKNITVCNSLDSETNKANERKFKRGKIVNIKKIRRVFKKKRVDYIICNIDEIDRFMRYFIKDSIYLSKKEIIIYGSRDRHDIEKIQKQYNRYKVVIDFKDNKHEFVFSINSEKAKSNKIKDSLYFIKDTLSEISDFISDILVT